MSEKSLLYKMHINIFKSNSIPDVWKVWFHMFQQDSHCISGIHNKYKIMCYTLILK